MINHKTTRILKEIDSVLTHLDDTQVQQLIAALRESKKIVCVGAGRIGYATRGFVMRLGHLGFEAYMLGDTTVPCIGLGDVLLACSGSGETQTTYDIVLRAKCNKAKVVLVTGNPKSRMGEWADVIVELKAPSKTKNVEGMVSIQPMTTLGEQCLGLFFDAVVLEMMDTLSESHESMWARHSNLE
jgi:6-phospho-3-hexuloisomerase